MPKKIDWKKLRDEFEFLLTVLLLLGLIIFMGHMSK